MRHKRRQKIRKESHSRTEPQAPCVTVLYHYFHPDDVVSARHFSDLAEGLAERGWTVTVRPCRRGCRDESQTFARRERWRGVDVRRIWRPRFRQASNVGRMLNATWMLAAWSWAAAFQRRRPREAMIVGTDPVLSVLVALPCRLLRRRTKIAHWCFDLYPEAALAEGMLRPTSLPVRLLKRLMAAAYRRCDLLIDLGPCMARRLASYAPESQQVTLTPWALVEPEAPPPPDPVVREALFGDAPLGLLYSGTFGRAHSYAEFLELARRLRGAGATFCFAGRGNRTDELRSAVTPEDDNVHFAGFAPEAELEKRLTACDLHLVSLRPDWTGTVVPSKFFGALAAGRGVVFAGSPHSAIARWIVERQVGWVLTPETVGAVSEELRRLAADPTGLAPLRERCHRMYHEWFSRGRVLDRWDAELRRLVGAAPRDVDAPALASPVGDEVLV
jgi:colanic acid biosynthesis glycosyl transferase WcaI